MASSGFKIKDQDAPPSSVAITRREMLCSPSQNLFGRGSPFLSLRPISARSRRAFQRTSVSLDVEQKRIFSVRRIFRIDVRGIFPFRPRRLVHLFSGRVPGFSVLSFSKFGRTRSLTPFVLQNSKNHNLRLFNTLPHIKFLQSAGFRENINPPHSPETESIRGFNVRSNIWQSVLQPRFRTSRKEIFYFLCFHIFDRANCNVYFISILFKHLLNQQKRFIVLVLQIFVAIE